MNIAQIPDWWPTGALRRHVVGKVVVCGRRLDPPPYSHVVDFPRLDLPLKGAYDNQIESNEEIVNVRLVPGNALFAAPNCWNVPTWRSGLVLLSIMFGRTQLGVSMVSARGRHFTQVESKKLSLPRPAAGSIPAILTALTELYADNGPDEVFTHLIRALLRCLDELVRHPVPQHTSRAHALLEDIRFFLQSHYQQEISRDFVASQFNITPNHLSRLFQSQGKMTFSSYITHVRVERAKHLLSSYSLKLDDIAARCGYNDTPYFCHVFKRVTHHTPIEYRLKVKVAILPKPLSTPPQE
jgi:AraC-like DNA-binding protein